LFKASERVLKASERVFKESEPPFKRKTRVLSHGAFPHDGVLYTHVSTTSFTVPSSHCNSPDHRPTHTSSTTITTASSHPSSSATTTTSQQQLHMQQQDSDLASLQLGLGSLNTMALQVRSAANRA